MTQLSGATKPANGFFYICALGLLCGLTPFAVDMYLPSIPDIAADLNSTTTQVQFTISAFLLAFSLGQLFYGPISDSWGRKRVLIFGLVIFIVSSLFSAEAQTLNQLLAWRGLQAFGGGAIGVCVNATLRDRYDGNQLAKMMSYLLIVTIIAPMIAPLIGGQLLKFFHWPTIFYLLAGLATFGLLLYSTCIKESHHKERRVKLELKSVWVNYKLILTDPKSLAYLLIGGFSSAPMFIFITLSPFIYLELFGVSQQEFGLYFGANVILMMTSSWVNTRLLNRVSYTKIMGAAIFIRVLPATALLFVSLAVEENLFRYLVPLIILSIGLLPLVGPNAMTALMSKHGQNAGSAASLAGTFRFGVGAIAGIIASIYSQQSHLSMAIGIFVCTLLCLLSYIWVKTHPQS